MVLQGEEEEAIALVQDGCGQAAVHDLGVAAHVPARLTAARVKLACRGGGGGRRELTRPAA